MDQSFISDLAIIGDQKTCSLITKSGNVVWYCPGKFDNPPLFASLLDPEKGGGVDFVFPEEFTSERTYSEDSAVLISTFKFKSGKAVVKDFMPIAEEVPSGICRMISESPVPYRIFIRPSPDAGRKKADIAVINKEATINNSWFCYSSHSLSSKESEIVIEVPAHEKAWIFIADEAVSIITDQKIENSLNRTLEKWQEIVSHITYHGPYESEVAESIRAIRLMTYTGTGGIIAAATTSLPEVINGRRNYDYRYVWLRDSGMIVSALTRAGSDGKDERRFLSFICDTAHKIPDYFQIPLFSVCQEKVANEETVNMTGYMSSAPVQLGNNANNQLQLDALGNVLIAAKVIYDRYNTREHWETISSIAGYLVENWKEPDYGLWEESTKRQFTSSKVIVAKGLEFLASYSEDEKQKKRWLQAVEDIKKFISENCLTSRGEYAAYAGCDAVDISAVLFPLWDFVPADTPEMQKTIKHIETNYCKENLYWRHLEDFDSKKEGAFLAATFWMAQYYVMLEDLERAKDIIDAALEYSTDLGYFSEEVDPETGQLLGNFPQTFVHASFIGAVIDYKEKQNQLKFTFSF